MDDGQEIYLQELDLDKAERQFCADLLKLQRYYLRLVAAGLALPASMIEQEIRMAESMLRTVWLMKEYQSRPVQLPLFKKRDRRRRSQIDCGIPNQ